MLREKITCPDCKKNVKVNFNPVENIFNLNSIKEVNCTKCLTIIQSEYTNENNEQFESTTDQENFIMPSNSNFLHLNRTYDYDANRLNENETKIKFRDKNVLMIGCNTIEKTTVMLSLLNLKFKLFVCLANTQEWAYDYVDDWIYADEFDINKSDETLNSIKSYCDKKCIQFDIIFTLDDYCVLMTSYLQNNLGLEHMAIPFDFLNLIKNKHQFRQLCQKLDINSPNNFLLNYSYIENYLIKYKSFNKNKLDNDYLYELNEVNKCKFPVIVKNVYGCGKDFVKKCENIKEFVECLEEILKEYANFDEKINCVVEEYFDGHEIDMDILIQNNELKLILIMDNFPLIQPWFFEVGSVNPSIYLNRQEKNAIKRIASKWVSKMNFQNAIIHFEARCRPKILYPNYNCNYDQSYEDWLVENEKWFLMPIEINSRLCGGEGLMTHLTAYNINLIHEYLRICAGFNLDVNLLEQKLNEPKYTLFCMAIHPTIEKHKNYLIKSIKLNVNQLLNNENLIEFNISKSTGKEFTFRDPIGYYLIKLDKYQRLNEDLDESNSVKVKEFVKYLFENVNKSLLELIDIKFC